MFFDYLLLYVQAETTLREAAGNAKHLVPNIDFDFRAMNDGCLSEIALGQIIDANNWCPHVIFGHTCDYTLGKLI